MTEPTDEPATEASSYEATEEQPRKPTVRVPTTRCASGEVANYIDADEDAAWMWDARRWGPLS